MSDTLKCNECGTEVYVLYPGGICSRCYFSAPKKRSVTGRYAQSRATITTKHLIKQVIREKVCTLAQIAQAAEVEINEMRMLIDERLPNDRANTIAPRAAGAIARMIREQSRPTDRSIRAVELQNRG